MAVESLQPKSTDSPPSPASTDTILPFNRLNKRKRSKRNHQLSDYPSSSEDQYIAQCLLMLSRTTSEQNIAPPADDRISGGSAVLIAGGRGHQCLICFRSFSTGQALGGHKRRHYDGTIGSAAGTGSAIGGCGRGLGFDLNLPAAAEFAGGAGWRCLEEEEEVRGSFPLKKPRFFLTV
ncbi:zinc finger protein 1-like [Phalaenopsis equestris]|uniref:zinc finger protein 1-like n=1 Tax=Phalaenopsis equestris TaxID=78828 RepID=UPI0009E3209C|nr:zinc finger protein 1-like [Phalaenopsis equestris]